MDSLNNEEEVIEEVSGDDNRKTEVTGMKKRKVIHDERDEEIKIKAESNAAHMMVTFAEVGWLIAYFKNSDAVWGFFALIMVGLGTIFFYKYVRENSNEVKEFKIYLYVSIVFIVVAIGSMIKFGMS